MPTAICQSGTPMASRAKTSPGAAPSLRNRRRRDRPNASLAPGPAPAGTDRQRRSAFAVLARRPFLKRWSLLRGLSAVLLLLAPDLALASGPDELPTGWSILGVEHTPGETLAVAHLDIDWQAYGRPDIDELDLEAASRHLTLALAESGVRAVRLRARPFASSDGAARDLVTLLEPVAPPPQRPWELPGAVAPDSGGTHPPAPDALAAPQPAVVGTMHPGVTGALTGRTVYLSPGHGWYWADNLGRWATQRGNNHDIVEDFVNAEGALHYLEPLLRNAGAQVIGVRELDHNPLQVIVDDGDPAPAGGASGYQEQGSWKAGTDKGFGNGKAPYQGSVNPFALGGYRATPVVKGTATASALFVPDVPKSGLYQVKVGWTAGSNRSKDAHFEIVHLGGSTHVRVDQSRHGQSWWPLGTFAFAAGSDPSKGAIVLHNDTLQAANGQVVIADVVRLGGGMEEIERGKGKAPAAAPTTLRPRWESCARYYTQYSGAPSTVWDSSAADNNDDVTSRSRYAGWHHEPPDDAVYLSWHSNAPDPARGTSTYIYGPNPPDGSKTYAATKGSVEFGGWLQKSIIADIHAEVDPKWKDRGLYSAYFGEVNPTHNPDMPAALVESAFHSTKADADYLREPRFRHLLSRAMTKAIIRYFAERDGKVPVIPPEAPLAVRAHVSADGAAFAVHWLASPTGGAKGDAAVDYLVETSSDGEGFSVAAEVGGLSATLPLPPGAGPRFVRLRARNPGGVSLPSSVIGVASGCAGAKRALVVQAFTRLQASQLPVDALQPWSLGNVQRLRQWQVNRFDYLRQHVADLAALGLRVDGAERAAVPAIDLGPYALLDWAAGEQSSEDGVLVAAERSQIAAWFGPASDGSVAARAMLLTGSEVGWTLGAKSDAAGADFLATWFGAASLDDDAGSYLLVGSAGGPLAGQSFAFDDGKLASGDGGTYHVDMPDAFTALPGAEALLGYQGGSGPGKDGAAAVRRQTGALTTIVVGVPLETVQPPVQRQALVQALVKAAGVATPTLPCEAGGGGDDAGGGADAGGDTASGGEDPAPDAGPDAADAAGGEDGGPGGDGADGAAIDATSPDGAGVDAGMDDAGPGDLAIGGDGGGPAGDAGPDAATSPIAPADPGCGCQVTGARPAATAGPVALVLALLALLGVQRRGFSPRPPPVAASRPERSEDSAALPR